jgi:hypothetical protein
MLRELSREELLDALAFYQLDPPGDRRADMRAMAAGMLASGSSERAPNMIYPYYGTTFDEEQEAEEFIDSLEQMEQMERNKLETTLPETDQESQHD